MLRLDHLVASFIHSLLVYTFYVACTRCRGVPEDSGTTIFVHAPLDQAQGGVYMGGVYELVMKNLGDIRNQVESGALLY